MDWTYWIGRKVFLRTKHGSFYQGIVEEVNDEGAGLIFIGLRDKFNKFVLVTSGEIISIKEEG